MAEPIPVRAYPGLDITGHADADLVLAVLDDWSPTAAEERGNTLRVFFATAAGRDAALQGLGSALPEVAITPVDIDDERWAERSQAALTAVRVGALTVAPPWDLPADRDGVIVILPSMGFGTGHHASTRLCLGLIQDVSLAGLRVCDVGTGSGVLALAAVRRGARHVLAMDNDPDAITCARESAELNGVTAGLDIELMDLENVDVVPGAPFDVLLANLTGGLLVRLAARLTSLTRAGGALILSGITSAELEAVQAAFLAQGCAVMNHRSEDGWEGVLLTSPTTTITS